ncbi:hypothetical protein E7Y31_16030, partial [Candidatus Frankia alpina]
VDAHFGVNQFRNDPIDGLRTVGPVWLDILHLIVRADSGIDDATQLCDRKISTGLNNSGSLQVGQVLFDNILNCKPATDPADLDRGLADLRDGKVDGVLWAGGAPTPQILRAVTEDGCGSVCCRWRGIWLPWVRTGTPSIASGSATGSSPAACTSRLPSTRRTIPASAKPRPSGFPTGWS